MLSPPRTRGHGKVPSPASRYPSYVVETSACLGREEKVVNTKFWVPN